MIAVWLGILIGLVVGATIGAIVMSCFAASGRASECERCKRMLQALKEARREAQRARLAARAQGDENRLRSRYLLDELEAIRRAPDCADPLRFESDATETLLQVRADGTRSSEVENA